MESKTDLLKSWYRRLRISQSAHYESSKSLSKFHLYFGVPTNLFSVVVGSSIFIQLDESSRSIGFQVAMGIISIGAGTLSTLQTFLNFEVKAEMHRVTGAKCGILRREIEQLLSSYREDELTPAIVNSIRKKYDQITKEAPKTSLKMYNRALKIVDGKSKLNEQKPVLQ